MRRTLIAGALAAALAWSPTGVLAQSFAAGYTKYQKGDFYGAEQVLRAALASTSDAPTKAKTYKFLGISQYMNGDKKGAAASFRAALELAQSLTISPSEVLDESVIQVFDAQKAALAPPPAPVATKPKTNAKTSAPPTVAIPAKTPQVGAPPPPAAPSDSTAPSASSLPEELPAEDPGSAASDGTKKPLKKTLLRIQSNAAEANIMMSGIIAGSANTPIEVDPGDIDVEVTAVGYQSRRVKVRAVKDRETVVTVDLEKEKPKKKKKGGGKKAPPAGDYGFFGDEPAPQARRSGVVDEFERDQVYSAPAPVPPPEPRQPRRSGPRPGNAFVSILPFGAGQFQSKRPWLGSALALAELGCIYYSYSEYQRSTAMAKDRDELIAERNAQGRELSDEDDEYVANSTKFVKDSKQNAIYGGAAFFGLWVAGVVDALLYERDLLLKQKAAAPRPGFAGTLAPLEGGGWSMALTWTPAP